MSPEKIRANLLALISEGEAVKATAHKDSDGIHTYIDYERCSQWSVNVLALLRSIFGEDGDHYLQAKARSGASHSHAVTLLAITKGALTAWDNGYVFEIRQLAEAEVEASLIDQAEALLDKGYHVPAAVLAGAVLEQHLRSISVVHGVSTIGANGRPKTIDPLNIDLCKAGAYDAIQQKRINYLAGIRNNAAHGSSITVDDAEALVRDTIDLCGKLR